MGRAANGKVCNFSWPPLPRELEAKAFGPPLPESLNRQVKPRVARRGVSCFWYPQFSCWPVWRPCRRRECGWRIS